jgi:hypothetical protein
VAHAVAAGNPARPADDCEQLLGRGWMLSDRPTGAHLDHGDVRLRRQPPNARCGAPEAIDFPLTGELDAPHAAASISSRAAAN